MHHASYSAPLILNTTALLPQACHNDDIVDRTNTTEGPGSADISKDSARGSGFLDTVDSDHALLSWLLQVS